MFNKDAANRYTLTEQEFSEVVGLSLAFVRQLRKQGRLPHVRIGDRVLYTQEDVYSFLESHRHAVAGEAA
jgi:excisionase family DNA binding protein